MNSIGLSFSDLTAIVLSLKLAAITTLILFVIGLPLAAWLVYSNKRWKIVIETIVALPIVLPPTVLGFYLLMMLGANGWLGRLWMHWFGHPLAFTFTGLVIGSVLYSLPFVVKPLQNAFESVGDWPLEVAATLGAKSWDRFWRVLIPMSKNGLITAATLGFAHTVGEFGVVLMIGGNIPGKTQVASIAIYDHVQQSEYWQANLISIVLLVLAFFVLLSLLMLNQRRKRQSA
jgi:molybdate transport system permease protein